MIKKILILLVIIFSIFFKCYADENTNFINDFLNEEIEKHTCVLDEGLRTIDKLEFGIFYPDFSIKDLVKKICFGKFEFNFRSILKTINKIVFKESLVGFKNIGFVIVMSIMCYVLCDITPDFSKKGVNTITFFSCFLSIAGVLIKIFYHTIEYAKNAINSLSVFINVLIPIISNISLLNSSATIYSILLVIVEASTLFVKNLLLPLIVLSGLVVVVNNASDKFRLTNLSTFMNKIVKWIFMTIVTVFGCVVGMHGIATKNATYLSVKLMKIGMVNLVPVVGRMLSESAEIVVGSASIIKNSLGAIGCVVIVLISLVSILKIFTCLIGLRVMAIITEPIADKKIISCTKGLAELTSTVLSIIVSLTTMFVIIIALTLKMTEIF